ncbi:MULTISPECIES: hypothetical protein [Burkholderiaceae]|nr:MULTISPECIES: hypothetical protein [Burkholderiaceae]MBW0450483.1 hypothetical protein [Paraburkholderia phenoliruptrix]MBW9098793.1 hypothetical protein [Paraburkholderia phenoliruptrix]MBW9104975.1 hypothetical protein [Paraburkholderia phenoliruptrix]MBW9132708.1 hypothetical protein [Paraburkholderia ginsengiterrae]
MKKIVLAIAAAAAVFGAIAPAQAARHHHPVCKKVHVHHHWERHCR